MLRYWCFSVTLLGALLLPTCVSSAASSGCLGGAANVQPLCQLMDSCGIYLHSDVHVLPTSELGRGMKAASAFANNTLILEVPPECYLSSSLVAEAPSLFEEVPVDEFSFYDLDAALLLHMRDTRGSPWTAYIDSLPSSVDLPIFWNKELLDGAKGSHLGRLVSQMRSASSVNYQDLIVDILGWQHRFSLDDYRWALSVLWSRVFSVRLPEGRRVPALVPIADMFNADLGQHQHQHQHQHQQMVRVQMTSEGALRYYTNKQIAKDTQLLVQYGRQQKSRYGDPVSDDYALVEVEDQNNVQHKREVQIHWGSFPFDLLKTFRSREATTAGVMDDELTRAINSGKPLKSHPRVEHAALRAMREVLQQRLLDYDYDDSDSSNGAVGAAVQDARVRQLLEVERRCLTSSIDSLTTIINHAFSKRREEL